MRDNMEESFVMDGPVVLSRRHEPTAVVRATADDDDDVASGDEDSDAEFEFPFVSRGSEAGAAAADELFSGGRVRAFYPVFGRVLDEAAPAPPAPRSPLGRLFQLDQARTSSVASTSSSSSSTSTADMGAGDLDGASPDSYCLWTPGSSSSAASSPSRPPRKSGSTGSIARWRRIGELVVGRSHSDGKEKFLFLSAPPSPAREHSSPASKSKAKQPPPKGSKAATAATEVDTVAAGRRVSYGGGSGGAKASTGGGRRTFLPYRQDLVGLFANVHGLRRSQHPF